MPQPTPQALFSTHDGLAHVLARRWGRGLEAEDADQIALTALWQAARDWIGSEDGDFADYARRKINAALAREKRKALRGRVAPLAFEPAATWDDLTAAHSLADIHFAVGQLAKIPDPTPWRVIVFGSGLGGIPDLDTYELAHLLRISPARCRTIRNDTIRLMGEILSR